MSAGQSLRKGSSVEPGLPKTFLLPNARNRSKVACLTVRGVVLTGRRGADIALPPRHCEELGDEAIQTISEKWILDCFASLAMTMEMSLGKLLTTSRCPSWSAVPRSWPSRSQGRPWSLSVFFFLLLLLLFCCVLFLVVAV